jgi:dihydroneopterin aldolase
MAVLAMDQHAHLIAARLSGGVIVRSAPEAAAAINAGSIPVLAPYSWLRDADPLPHSWDVTSDSIAAWIAGALGARRLVLVKPPGASGDGAVDPYFLRVLPEHVAAELISADRIGELVPAGALHDAPPR